MGIGAVLKRKADRLVASGKDASDADQFFTMLRDCTKTRLYQITDQDVESVANIIPKNIQVLKGTMAVHQMATAGNGLFIYREVSSFCKKTKIFVPDLIRKNMLATLRRLLNQKVRNLRFLTSIPLIHQKSLLKSLMMKRMRVVMK
ncbi:hypothetical protein AVEN_226792-1 [Araneus ventricosus]|uniref:Uncharacterized protein n=1 Tax=Araneus ventricosus TaxID=182803 RepID=A0A4Y2THL8_ARAVE|nr:hypothetical protein AVEN_226792-1 [Araneus ventricosus]